MTEPTLHGGPFVFNVNNLFSESDSTNTSKRALLEIKNTLVALGGAGIIWQVVASSNASSVVNKGGGSPDLWSIISDVNFAGDGSPHSWIVLENQTTGAELCIDYNNASYYSRTSIFFSPGGTFSTDGTINDRPTDTDCITIWHNNYPHVLGTGYHKFAIHAMTSASHKTLRLFVVFKNTSTGIMGAKPILIEEVFDAPSQWNDSTIKYTIHYVNYNTTTSSNPVDMSPKLQELDGLFYCFVETTEPYAGWLTAYPTTICWGSLSNNTAQPVMLNSENQTLLGGYPLGPIGLFRLSTSRGGSMGKLRDIYFAQSQQDMYDTCPADASRTWVKIGCLLVPWNGSVPLYSE